MIVLKSLQCILHLYKINFQQTEAASSESVKSKEKEQPVDKNATSNFAPASIKSELTETDFDKANSGKMNYIW